MSTVVCRGSAVTVSLKTVCERSDFLKPDSMILCQGSLDSEDQLPEATRHDPTPGRLCGGGYGLAQKRVLDRRQVIHRPRDTRMPMASGRVMLTCRGFLFGMSLGM